MTTSSEGNVTPGSKRLEGMRRRQFLGVLGGAVLASRALGASFLRGPAEPPQEPVNAEPCVETVSGTSSVATTVSYPSSSWSTRITMTLPQVFTTTGVVYTTVRNSGVTTTVLGQPPSTTTAQMTTTFSGTISATQSVTQSGTLQTIRVTHPSGTKSDTVSQTWTYTKSCAIRTVTQHVPGAGLGPVQVGMAARQSRGDEPRAIALARGVSVSPGATVAPGFGV